MWNLIKKFIPLPLVCLAGLMIACQPSEDKKDNSLVVGLQAGYPPYEFIDANGKIVGFDVDVAHALAEKLGKKAVIKEMSFDALIIALKQSKIDLIISGMSITPDRLKEIAMVPYYGDSLKAFTLLFWNTIPPQFSSFELIKGTPGIQIAVQSGTLQEQFLKTLNSVKSKSFENIQELVMDIKYGKSTAALVEPHIGKQLSLQIPEIKLLEAPLPLDMQVLGNGIGINKENKDLITSIAETIDEMKASGEMEEIHKKWFKDGTQ